MHSLTTLHLHLLQLATKHTFEDFFLVEVINAATVELFPLFNYVLINALFRKAHDENMFNCWNGVYSLAMKEIVFIFTCLNDRNMQVPIKHMCETSSIIQSAKSGKTHSCVYYNCLVSAASFSSSGSLQFSLC